jgi:hypothetical protein
MAGRQPLSSGGVSPCAAFIKMVEFVNESIYETTNCAVNIRRLVQVTHHP